MIDELKTKNIYFVYDQGFRIFRGRRHQLRNQSKKFAVSATGVLITNSAAKINLCKNLFDERFLQKKFFEYF